MCIKYKVVILGYYLTLHDTNDVSQLLRDVLNERLEMNDRKRSRSEKSPNACFQIENFQSQATHQEQL